MIETTAGRAIANSVIPRDLRDYDLTWDSKTVSKILDKVGTKYPKDFKDIVYKIKRIGQKVAYIHGSSPGMKDFFSPVDKSEITEKEKLVKNLGNVTEKKMRELEKEFADLQQKIEKNTLTEGLKKGNILAYQVFSGARGKPSQLASTISSPVMYTDNMGKPVLVPIKHSFSEGLDPVEYWASSYGTRKGTVATKFATPDTGAFNKEVSYSNTSVLITEDDCKTTNGVRVPTDDSENLGRSLAVPTKSYPRDTILSNQILSDLIKDNVKYIVIRSPITCEAKDGVCQKCYGFSERGNYPELGYNIGINSAAALTEPFTQGAMNTKHTGGVIGQVKAGFSLIKQLLHVPKVFSGKSTLAELSGKIDSITKAPQGGYYVSIGDTKHYVHPERQLLHKEGDEVEIGTSLSDGIVNPQDVTRLRGVGEGRKNLYLSLKKAYNEDGKKVNKIHMETLAKNIVNHVRINDDSELDDNLPGDVITLTKAQSIYKPTKAQIVKTEDGVGKYLAKQYLHYTVGTKLTPSMVNELASSGYKAITVTDYEPPFSSLMIRLDDIPAYKDNWIERLYSNHLKQRILDSVSSGEKATISGKDFVPAYIHGLDFGKRKIGY